ncbi:hypothetical protein B296_00044487, partial [Ensete ventricosum]
PAEAAGKKSAEEHPAGIEERYAKQSAASGHSHPWPVNPAPIAAQPPPFLALEVIPAPRGEEAAALLRLKSRIAEAIAVLPCLESPIAEVTIVLPCLNLPQNDHRGEITQGSNRPPLPAHRSVGKRLSSPAPIASASRAQAQEKAVTLPWEKAPVRSQQL